MKCTNCGNEISSNYAACPYCGVRIIPGSSAPNQYVQNTGSNSLSYCAGCGVKVPHGYKFCPACTEKHISKTKEPEIKTTKNNNTGVIVAILVVLIIGVVAVIAGYILLNPDKQETYVEDTVGGGGGGSIPAVSINEDESPAEEKETVSTYNVIFSDNPYRLMSWAEANRKASRMGGQIVCVNSYEEFTEVCKIAEDAGLYMFWLGARRKNMQDWEDARWVDGSPITYTNWLENEPSYFFEDEEERYLMAIKNGGKWYFNDSFEDVSNVYDIEKYRDKLACIVEIER